MPLTCLGIYREPEYSPGRHTSNDALILRLVGQALERLGVSIKLVSLEEARTCWKDAELIVSMCQGPEAVAELMEWKKQGARILNDPTASRKTYRDQLCELLRAQNLAFPRSDFLRTDSSMDLVPFKSYFEKGSAWLKRHDVHAMQAGDVLRLMHWEELAPALKTFAERGLRQAVLQENRQGDEVKFYAIRGGTFFWPYYPKDCYGYPFDETKLQALAEAAAEALGVQIYGGDAIISPEGNITLIDLNDFPSFAPCRGAAAHAIAQFIKDTHHALQNNRKATAAR